MGKGYRSYEPDQDYLLPPSLRDWLPENHLAYFVSDVIDNVDLRRWMRCTATSGEDSRRTIPG